MLKKRTNPPPDPKDDEFSNGETIIYYDQDGEQQVRFVEEE